MDVMKSAPFYLVGTLAYFARWRRLLNEGSYLFIFQILGQAFSKVQGHAGNFSRVGKGLWTSFAPPPCHQYPSAFADMYQPSTDSLTWQGYPKNLYTLQLEWRVSRNFAKCKSYFCEKIFAKIKCKRLRKWIYQISTHFRPNLAP